MRTRRVTSVTQIGTDRIIEIQFSDGQYRLFLEFYAAGNIILTNKELGILALYRVVAEGAEQERLRVGLSYSLENRQNYGGAPELTPQRVREGLEKAASRATAEQGIARKSKRKGGDLLRKALSTTLNEFPPPLLEHALRHAEIDLETTSEKVLGDEGSLKQVHAGLVFAQGIIKEVTSSDVRKGYIVAKRKEGKSKPEDSEKENSKREDLLYDDFQPFRPSQFDNRMDYDILEFGGFNKTVDEFFSSVESQKLESRLTEREQAAQRKLDNARKDHARRVEGLQEVQEFNVRKAIAIESNLHKVQEATGAINGLIAQGMDWVEIARLIEMEQARHNPVAGMIKLPLKLYENTATLLLQEPHFDEDDYEGDETDSDVSESEDEDVHSTRAKSKAAERGLAVDVDLALSPWANARQYYEHKKSAAVKEQKTLQASEKALKSTEEKVQADLKKGLKQEKEVMRPTRKQMWFEKFLFFISSEGYLVIGGRDASQNEILYRRYLQKGDVFVHADLHGAASIIVKNKTGFIDSPIPPSTLSQAGTLAVATSSAWDSKAGMSAWWVNVDQVSKTAPTGEYLTTGGFTIRGHKNYLPPAQLLLGFAIMFRVSDESKARHVKHRIVDDVDHKQNSKEREPSATSDENKEDYDEDGHLTSGDANDDEETGGDPNSGDDNQEVPDFAHDSDVADNSDQSEEENRQDIHNPLQPHRVDDEFPGQESDGGPGSAPEAVDDADGSADEASSVNNSLRGRNPVDTPSQHQPPEQPPQIPNNSGSEHSNGEPPSQPDPIPTTTTPSSTPTRQVRGKHGKRQKIKQKYADQTPEDRALALRILGSNPATSHQATALASEKATREAQLLEQKERRHRQHLLAAQRGKEAEEKRLLNLQEGIIETLDTEEVKSLQGLDAWVGTPLPGDEVLDCMVVCGPWDAVGGRCRWRAKIQPGGMKKGKAVREILGRWGAEVGGREKKMGGGGGGRRRGGRVGLMREDGGGKEGEGEFPDDEEDERREMEARKKDEEEEKLMRREGELIKALREAEIIGVMPVGKCRVVMGGGGGGGAATGGDASKKGKGGGGGQAGKGNRGGRGSKKK